MLTLALGLGATTAIFSAVNPILFEPLPYPEADRIATIAELEHDGSRNAGTFRHVSRARRAHALVRGDRRAQGVAADDDECGQPERLEGQRVSASYFQVLGVPPLLGRIFEPADDRANGPNVIILSDALWRRRFGGDRAIIGRPITLDDDSHVVIGVMPSGFENVLAPAAELWAPLQYEISQGRAWGHHLRTIGRLGPGVSVDQASARGQVHSGDAVTRAHPESYGREVRRSPPLRCRMMSLAA